MLFKRKCKITYIAHGTTIYSEEHRLSDNENYPPLSDKGREDAEKIAKWVVRRSPRVDKIYTSIALRCLQTARVICAYYKKDFEIASELYNRKAGLWSGLSYNEIEKKYPEMLKKYHNNPSCFWPNDGETLLDLDFRVKNAIDEIVEKNLTKRIIIITHPDIIRAAIHNAMGIPVENQNKVFIPPGSATQINYYTSWQTLVYSGHLPV